MACWHADLQEYDFIIKHIPGKINTPADELSCPPNSDQGDNDNKDQTLLKPKLFVNATHIPLLSELSKRNLMTLIHDHPMAGHPGRDKTIRKAAETLPWTGMCQWIADYVKGCAICQQNKIMTHKKKIPLYHITTKEGTLPFQQIAMDLIMGLLQQHGHNAILTIVDHRCSRAAIFLLCSDTITGPGIAQLYLDYIYRWFGLPTKMISNRDPRFTSHFGKALTEKLGIQRNLSTAFHPQTDGLSERKNQWIEQYLRLVTSNDPKGWTHWLALATMVHNNRINTTTGLSPNQILFGYNPTLNSDKVLQTHNALVESRIQTMTKNCADTIRALNKVANQKGPPLSQFHLQEQVWLDTSHLKLPHQKAKLTPKCLGPFKITQEISPVAYQLELPTNWQIHDVFHASLLTLYHETTAHGPNFTRPPPDLIDEEEEYKVKRIVAHQQFGRSKRLQYLIKWKGYPESDNTWEPADQVHAPDLIKHYQSVKTHQSSTAYLQSAIRKMHQSAPSQSHIKTLKTLPQLSIECPTIFPTSQSNASQTTSLSKTSHPSNALSMTSTPLNPAPTASSAFATSSAWTTYQYITGIVNYPTAPFITATSPCRISLAMTPQNPLAPQATEDPLPQLSSICLLKSSPRCSQAPSSHVPGYLDSLLPLPMLQYPQDPPPLPTTSSPSDKCHPDWSTVLSPATISPQTPTSPSSMDSLSPPKPAPTNSSRTWQTKKRTTKRSWMTVKRQSSSSKPTSSGISTLSPNLPRATSRTADSPPSPSP